jgi:hypothetical protein
LGWAGVKKKNRRENLKIKKYKNCSLVKNKLN